MKSLERNLLKERASKPNAVDVPRLVVHAMDVGIVNIIYTNTDHLG
jgi:hypothetical protein